MPGTARGRHKPGSSPEPCSRKRQAGCRKPGRRPPLRAASRGIASPRVTRGLPPPHPALPAGRMTAADETAWAASMIPFIFSFLHHNTQVMITSGSLAGTTAVPALSPLRPANKTDAHTPAAGGITRPEGANTAVARTTPQRIRRRRSTTHERDQRDHALWGRRTGLRPEARRRSDSAPSPSETGWSCAGRPECPMSPRRRYANCSGRTA